MKITVYNCRDCDERELFLKYEKELGVEIQLCTCAPTQESAALSQGSLCISIITTAMPAELLETFASY